MENRELVKYEVSKVIRDTQKVISNFESRLKLKKAELIDVENIKKGT